MRHYTSSAANLVPGQTDTNGNADVFLYDRVATTTVLVSHAAGLPTTAGSAASSNAVLSANGRFVAFVSQATDLVAGVTLPPGNINNVYLFDRTTGGCTLVSHAVDFPLLGGSYDAQAPKISADGEVVVFASRSVNLVANPGDLGPATYAHVYAFERATGVVTLLDHASSGATTFGDREGNPADVSGDGRYVAFWSYSGNLLAGNTTSKGDAYRFDRQTGVSLLLSRSGFTAPFGGNGFSGPSDMSDDGRWIALASSAKNLISGATTSGLQVLIGDADTGSLTLVSHAPGSPLTGGNGEAFAACVSEDGQRLFFVSAATNLVGGFVDGNGKTGYDAYFYDRATDTNVLVSHQAGSATVSANAGVNTVLSPLSADGRYAAFASLSTDLVPGFVDNDGTGFTVGPDGFGYDVFCYDRVTGSIQLMSGSHGSGNVSGNGGALGPALSADGSTLAFLTLASDVVPGVRDSNGQSDVYVRNFPAGTTSLVSRRFGAPSLSPGGASQWAQVSADGRYVTFTSTATNLVPGQVDGEQTVDVFLTDRQTQTTWLVSHALGNAAAAANAPSAIPVISGDGRFVAYCSDATNLVAGFIDGNGSPGDGSYANTDVYLFDRLTGDNTLVSHVAGAAANGGNHVSGTSNQYPDYLLTISDDGRYVGYMSLANDLVAGFVDHNGTTVANNKGADIYVFDRVTGANEVVSHTAGLPLSGGNGSSYNPSISADGRYVAFWSGASDLVAGMTGTSGREVIVYDRQTGVAALVSHAAGSPTTPGNGGSNNPVISKDGNYVVFASAADTLVPGTDPNFLDDVFLYDRQAGTNVLVSHRYDSATAAGSMSSDISVADGSMNDTAISADGRFVVFESQAGDLVSGFVDGNGQETIGGGANRRSDVFLFDRLTGANTLISRTAASATTSGDRESNYGSLSGDGRFVTFMTWATNLAAAGTRASDMFNVYLYDRLDGSLKLVSASVTGVTLTAPSMLSHLPTLSRDGSAVVYVSTTDNLVAGDFNSFADVFAYVTPPPRVQSVQINDGSPQRSTVRSLTVTFDQPVFFAGDPAAAFALTSQAGGVQLAAGSMVGNSLTLTFSGSLTQFASLIDGKYTLTVLANQVSNVGPLDGNGDGLGGDNYTFAFHRLFGDADGDADVDATEFGAFRQAFGTAGVAFDFDNDGDVDASDFGQFRMRFGSSV